MYSIEHRYELCRVTHTHREARQRRTHPCNTHKHKRLDTVRASDLPLSSAILHHSVVRDAGEGYTFSISSLSLPNTPKLKDPKVFFTFLPK